MPDKRETAEEKIARLVDERLKTATARAEEDKDPNKKWLRGAIREEVSAALADLTGKAPRKPAAGGGEGGDEGGEGSIIKSLFG